MPTKKKRTKANRSKTAKKRVTAPKRGTNKPKLKATRGHKEMLMTSGPQNSPGAGVAPGPCKISPNPSWPNFKIKATDMQVTINLCKDATGAAATEVQLVSVIVYDDTGAPVPSQPTKMTATSFTLDLKKPGTYDINTTVGPGAGAILGSKPTVYLYEACSGTPKTQLCVFITSAGPGCSFTLEVI